MRPLELTLKGFRSYREQTTFDWRGRRLVGVVGPIGAGKSSILDAVAFALYGKTPTYERDTKSLIHQRADECHVQLWFEVDGEVWRAARGLRRRGQSGHQLWHHAGDDPDSEIVEHVTGERAVRERVDQLLGMDFSAFCRSVLLAQNRFADFLKATPNQRNEVLKGVFGYERFDGALLRAKDLGAKAAIEVEAIERESTEVSAAREALGEAGSILADTVDRLAVLGTTKRAADESAERAQAAARLLEGVHRELAALEEAAACLPDRDRLRRDVAVASEAETAIQAAERNLTEADAERKQVEAAYAAVAERSREHAAFSMMVQELDHLAGAAAEAARRLETTSEGHAAAIDAAARAEADGAAAARSLESAERALADATAALEVAERTLHEARHADMAIALRAELVDGQSCPVCAQLVATVPAAVPGPAVADAETAAEAARRVQSDARAQELSAANDAATTTERRSALDEQVTRAAADLAAADDGSRAAEAAVAAVQSELVARLGEGDPRKLLAEHAAELRDSERARTQAADRLEEARSELEGTREAADRAREQMTVHATTIAATWGMLGEPKEIAASAATIETAFAEAGETIVGRNDDARAREAEFEADIERAHGEAAAALETAGLEPGEDLAAAIASAAAARGAAEERVATLRARIESGTDLDARLSAAERSRDLARRLTSDLQPSRFLAFLLEEERTVLADLGSTHLAELTDGAYRFTDDDRFDVLDMNAGATQRRADSLSGGETFLASLALALALAEMVARGGGRLDAFFLDEGFGSLDAEHLDRAMDGIGRLVAGHERRLVVLVSHVEQLKESIEDLIVLDKADITGDTIVVWGASPAI